MRTAYRIVSVFRDDKTIISSIFGKYQDLSPRSGNYSPKHPVCCSHCTQRQFYVQAQTTVPIPHCFPPIIVYMLYMSRFTNLSIVNLLKNCHFENKISLCDAESAFCWRLNLASRRAWRHFRKITAWFTSFEEDTVIYSTPCDRVPSNQLDASGNEWRQSYITANYRTHLNSVISVNTVL